MDPLLRSQNLGEPRVGSNALRLKRIEEEQRAQESLKKDRFSHWSIRGYAYTRLNHINVPELDWTDSDGVPRRRKAWSGPGVVWVGLDLNGSVLFQDWPRHYKEPMQNSATKLIDFDLSVRLDIFEKCHRLHETARCFQLAEEAGYITRHEAQLIIDFDVCYNVGVKLLKHKKILPGLDPWPELAQQQQRGKEIFAELQKQYGSTLFPCMETVTIAARYLDNVWDGAGRWGYQWLLDDSKFLDIFLLRMHNFMWRTHRPAKHRQTIYNLPLGDDDLSQGGLQDVFERDRDTNGLGRNIVKTRDRLKVLAEASPIATAACRAEIRRPRGLVRDEKNESFIPILEPGQESSISLLQFRRWLEVFYRNSDKPRTLPTVVEPLAIMESAEAKPDTVALLETIADHLAPYSHHTLVQMVWRDFLVPAADEGDEYELIDQGGHLVLMVVRGEEPRVYPYYMLNAVINDRNQDDDENDDSDDNLFVGAYDGVDGQSH